MTNGNAVAGLAELDLCWQDVTEFFEAWIFRDVDIGFPVERLAGDDLCHLSKADH